jgi:hypothetical protein
MFVNNYTYQQKLPQTPSVRWKHNQPHKLSVLLAQLPVVVVVHVPLVTATTRTSSLVVTVNAKPVVVVVAVVVVLLVLNVLHVLKRLKFTATPFFSPRINNTISFF